MPQSRNSILVLTIVLIAEALTPRLTTGGQGSGRADAQEEKLRLELPVMCLAISDDGKRLAVGGGTRNPAGEKSGAQGFVGAYNLETFQPIWINKSQPVGKVLFWGKSAESVAYLAWAPAPARVYPTDPKEGAKAAGFAVGRVTIEGDIEPRNQLGAWEIGLDPSSRRVAYSGLYKTYLEELSEKNPKITEFFGDPSAALYFSRDGSRLLAVVRDPPRSEREVGTIAMLFDVASHKQLARFDPDGGIINFVHFTDKSRPIAFVTKKLVYGPKALAVPPPPKLYVTEPDFGKKLCEVTLQSSTRALAVAPDGKSVAVQTSEEIVSIFAIPSAEKIRDLPGHKEGVNCLDFSSAGDLLAIGCGSTTRTTAQVTQKGCVYLWNTKTWEQVKVLR